GGRPGGGRGALTGRAGDGRVSDRFRRLRRPGPREILVRGLVPELVRYQQQLADAGENAAQGLRRCFLDAFADLRTAHVTLSLEDGISRGAWAGLYACRRRCSADSQRVFPDGLSSRLPRCVAIPAPWRGVRLTGTRTRSPTMEACLRASDGSCSL